MRPFVDPVTYGKVVIIKGSYEPGSANDEKMIMLVGTDWREKCRVDAEKQDKISSPGYNHAKYWPAAIRQEQEYFENKQKAKKEQEEQKEQEKQEKQEKQNNKKKEKVTIQPWQTMVAK